MGANIDLKRKLRFPFWNNVLSQSVKLQDFSRLATVLKIREIRANPGSFLANENQGKVGGFLIVFQKSGKSEIFLNTQILSGYIS